jgi:heme/copper-type cytochrome/quinol oxidase subunit 2
MAEVSQAVPPTRWTARRLGCLGVALPIVAFAFMIFFSVAVKDRRTLTDLEGTIALLVVAAVPVAAITGIVLCIIAFRRARRDEPGGGRSLAIVGTLIAIATVGLLALLVYFALQGLAGFR